MLDELHVRDVALIKEAAIEPSPGLTVLTGETGTGKSALLSAIKLLMGERADATAVREGADALEVEGRFFMSDDDIDGTVVRRRVEARGRGRVEIDGRPASVHELADGVGSTIDLCGQHEHQRLLDPDTHASLIDAWIGDDATAALSAYREALAKARDAKREVKRVREMVARSADEVDEAAFVMNRIDEVGPKEGELEELEERLPRVEHAETLVRATEGARSAITDDGGVDDALSEAISGLRDAAQHDAKLDTFAEALESALIDIEDVASDLRSYADSVELDPEALQQMQDRMGQLQGLLRTYGPRMEDVFERRRQAAEVVSAAQDGDGAVREAEKALDEAERSLAEAADALDALRKKAAPELARQVTAQMARLQMGSAELGVSIERLPRAQWGSLGPSKVELTYKPGAGLTPRPLRRIASGGEVSRVMLAIKVVLGEADHTQTLVFDEVDAGVGGATARSLAQVLASLAKTHQVIVVTHLAQVAVYGDRHYLVSKEPGDVPATTITEITGEDRVREIARMLSGETTDASLTHARELLREARGQE